MKHVTLLVFLFCSTQVQANDMLPSSSVSNSLSLIDSGQNQISTVTPKTPGRADEIVSSLEQSNHEYYHQQAFGHYSFRSVQYPLFHYLPEVNMAALSHSSNETVKQFQDIHDILNYKTEQAIKRNHEDELLIYPGPEERHNKMNLAGTELSEITASSLIYSARKKQHLEALIPGLLNNQRLFLRDREKLEKLFDDFKNNHKITQGDEIWLQNLSRQYHSPKIPF